MATFEIKDKNGNIVKIKGLKGDKGDPIDVQVDGVSVVENGVANIPKSKNGVYIGDGEMPEDCVLRINPNGEVTTAVQNILINGTSIVNDGVANIPIASKNEHGLTKMNDNFGFRNNANGEIYVFSDPTHIEKRKSYHPLVINQIDLAVKAAMCDGKGQAWTFEEQASARGRMGLEWRYIGKVETTEDVARMEMALDENGQPFNLRKVRVKVVNYPNASDLNTNIRLCFNNKTEDIFHDSTMITGVKSTETNRACEVIVEKICNHLFPISTYSSLNNNAAYVILNSNNTASYRSDCNEIDGYINQIYLYSWQSVIGAGAYMEVWGVDA